MSDTPMTDALDSTLSVDGESDALASYCSMRTHASSLERQLTESRAELARVRQETHNKALKFAAQTIMEENIAGSADSESIANSILAMLLHDSDCSLHNAPAYPAGSCDCSAMKEKK